MADRMRYSWVLGLALCGTASSAIAADPSTGNAVGARELPPAAPTRLHELLLRHISVTKRSRPEWLLERSHDDMDPEPTPGDDGLQLVVQEDRRDGADLLTLRYPLAEAGALRTYAGVGLNQAVYFVETNAVPALNGRGNRRRSMGAAAEFGAELRFSERVNLTADVRWIEIDDRADMIKSGPGLVGAAPVSYGFSIGWRFR